MTNICPGGDQGIVSACEGGSQSSAADVSRSPRPGGFDWGLAAFLFGWPIAMALLAFVGLCRG